MPTCVHSRVGPASSAAPPTQERSFGAIRQDPESRQRTTRFVVASHQSPALLRVYHSSIVFRLFSVSIVGKLPSEFQSTRTVILVNRSKKWPAASTLSPSTGRPFTRSDMIALLRAHPARTRSSTAFGDLVGQASQSPAAISATVAIRGFASRSVTCAVPLRDQRSQR